MPGPYRTPILGNVPSKRDLTKEVRTGNATMPKMGNIVQEMPVQNLAPELELEKSIKALLARQDLSMEQKEAAVKTIRAAMSRDNVYTDAAAQAADIASTPGGNSVVTQRRTDSRGRIYQLQQQIIPDTAGNAVVEGGPRPANAPSMYYRREYNPGTGETAYSQRSPEESAQQITRAMNPTTQGADPHGPGGEGEKANIRAYAKTPEGQAKLREALNFWGKAGRTLKNGM